MCNPYENLYASTCHNSIVSLSVKKFDGGVLYDNVKNVFVDVVVFIRNRFVKKYVSRKTA